MFEPIGCGFEPDPRPALTDAAVRPRAAMMCESASRQSGRSTPTISTNGGRSVKKMIAIAGLTFALTTSVHAEELTAADVAALPQDRVRKIIKECHMADNNLIVQDMCERMQLEALK